MAAKCRNIYDVKDGGNNDCEEPEIPIIGADRATSEYGVILESESDGVIHT